MDEARRSRTLTVFTDDFLTYTLHYALGEGAWNYGDGHVWSFDDDKLPEVKRIIRERFSVELDKLIDEALKEREQEEQK